MIKELPAILRLFRHTKQLRRNAGVYFPEHKPQKPDYLLFVNSFFGLEIPRDLPPLAAPVGPILAEKYPPLDAPCGEFLSNHTNTMYIALGTHVILTQRDVEKIMHGLFRLLDEHLIDGVIWALGAGPRQDLDPNHRILVKTLTTVKDQEIRLGDLLDGKDPNWLFPYFAPQRAVLAHESTRIYFTHGGGSSANEGTFHGKKMLSMGIFSDQIANTTRLAAAGVAESLHKFRFTSDEIYTKAKRLLQDKDGTYQRNTLRMMRIAHVASQRKYYAADLMEEVLYDSELRFSDEDDNYEHHNRRELRPMHLQTADMRMPAYKAKNWDMMAVCSLTGICAAGFSVWLGKFFWQSFIVRR